MSDLPLPPQSSSGASAGGVPVGGTSGSAASSASATSAVTPVTPAASASSASAPVLTAAEIEQKYTIPSSVKEKYPDLIPLILQTESMNSDERDYWFQVLPIMSDDQIVKLRDILVNEKGQLKQIDEEYAKEMADLTNAHQRDWDALHHKEQMKSIERAEQASEEGEKAKEEEMLRKLNDAGV